MQTFPEAQREQLGEALSKDGRRQEVEITTISDIIRPVRARLIQEYGRLRAGRTVFRMSTAQADVSKIGFNY